MSNRSNSKRSKSKGKSKSKTKSKARSNDNIFNQILSNVAKYTSHVNANVHSVQFKNQTIHDYSELANAIIRSTQKESKNVMFGSLTIQIMNNGYGIDIDILNQSGEICIQFTYYPSTNTIYLSNYYHTTPIHTCDKMEHKWFFETFLVSLCKSLKVTDVTLTDLSKKTFTKCSKVPNCIFAFAKDSFYQKFGFKNPPFETYIQQNKNLTFGQFMLNHANIDDVYFAFTTLLKDIPLNELKMHVICKNILDSCKNGNGEILQYKDRIIAIIEKHIPPNLTREWKLTIT